MRRKDLAHSYVYICINTYITFSIFVCDLEMYARMYLLHTGAGMEYAKLCMRTYARTYVRTHHVCMRDNETFGGRETECGEERGIRA